MKVAIFGGRGNGTVLASCIEDCRKAGQDIEMIGFLNDHESEPINGYPVLGGIQDGSWEDLPDDVRFLWALSNVKQAPQRHRFLQELDMPPARFANIIHPTAIVSDQATLGHGIAIMPLAQVGPNVVVGDHSQLYAQSFVGHDTTLREMVFVANNASIGGRITVEDGAHIGSNSSILERVTIGAYAVVGIGTVVVKDVEPYTKVVGNPARAIGTLEPASSPKSS